MSSKKPSKSKSSKLAMTIDDFTSSLNLLIWRPFKDIKSVIRHDRKQFTRSSKKDFTILGLPAVLAVGILSLLAKVVLAPLEVWSTLSQKRKLNRSTCYAIGIFGSSIAVWMTCVVWSFAAGWKVEAIRQQAKMAVAAAEYESAARLFESLQESEESLSSIEQFQYAQALAKTNRGDEANEILNQLAPSSGVRPGYPPAHRFAAISLVRTNDLPYSSNVQRLLKWHLDSGSHGAKSVDDGLRVLLAEDSVAAGGSQKPLTVSDEAKLRRESDGGFSPEFYFAKARYFESTHQFQAAIEPMKIAAQQWPELHLAVASLCQRSGNRELELRSLADAKKFFASRVAANPNDSQSRILLAKVFLKLADPESAKQQLLAGAKIAPDVFHRHLSSFYLQQCQQLPANKTTRQHLDLLGKSIRYDPDNVAVYEAVVSGYRNLVDVDRALVWQLLDQSQADYPQSPMPRFAKGILHRMDNRLSQSKTEIEAAYVRIDPARPGFSVVANNLAWLLAHHDNPDLDAAMKLARLAVDRQPQAGGLRDTLATILMKKGELEPALNEFQKSLPTVRNKSAVHLKMAKIYDALNQPQLATLHRNRASN